MNKTWIIARHEFLTAVKRTSYVLITLSFPILALLGMGIYQGVSMIGGEGAPPEEKVIGYVDDAGLINSSASSDSIVFVAYNTSEEPEAALLEGNISEYYFIPQDYIERGAVSRFTTIRELAPSSETVKYIEDLLIAN